MKTSHTPGPWHVSEVFPYVIVQNGSAGFVCVGMTNSDRKIPRADMYLIAAAPDLLAALEEIAKGAGPFSRDALTHASNTIDYMKEVANAAIRKARGEA